MVFSGIAAKASLISMRSMSPIVMPAFARQRCVAGVGPVSMMIGSVAAVAVATMRARGRSPWAFA